MKVKIILISFFFLFSCSKSISERQLNTIIDSYENYNAKGDDDYKTTWEARLVKAYPYTVASIPYSAGPAQLVKVTVGFYYEYSNLITSV